MHGIHNGKDKFALCLIAPHHENVWGTRSRCIISFIPCPFHPQRKELPIPTEYKAGVPQMDKMKKRKISVLAHMHNKSDSSVLTHNRQLTTEVYRT
jgi:hypothetical protein